MLRVRVVEQFFEDERRLLVYVCRASRREKLRHRLFANWFRQHNEDRLVRRVVGEEHEPVGRLPLPQR